MYRDSSFCEPLSGLEWVVVFWALGPRTQKLDFSLPCYPSIFQSFHLYGHLSSSRVPHVEALKNNCFTWWPCYVQVMCDTLINESAVSLVLAPASTSLVVHPEEPKRFSSFQRPFSRGSPPNIAINMSSLQVKGALHWMYLDNTNIGQSQASIGIWPELRNSVISFTMFMPCFTMAWESAFSTNKGYMVVNALPSWGGDCWDAWSAAKDKDLPLNMFFLVAIQSHI